MASRHPKTVIDLLCAGRRTTERFAAMLAYAASRDADSKHKQLGVDLRGCGPALPVDPGVVDAVHIALRTLPKRNLLFLRYEGFGVVFSAGSLYGISTLDDDAVSVALRVAGAWMTGIRLGKPHDERTRNGMTRWRISRSRTRRKRDGPPNLTRSLLRSGAIASPEHVRLLRGPDPWVYVVLARHPSVALEILEASPLRTFLSGRVVVGNEATPLLPITSAGEERPRGTIF